MDVVDVVDAPLALPTYAQVLVERFAALPDRERVVLFRRLVQAEPETLELIAKGYGLTRERVRQIEEAGLSRLDGAPSRKGGSSRRAQVVLVAVPHPIDAGKTQVVRQALTDLGELQLPVTEAALAEAGFAPLNSPGTRLLLGLARRNGVFGKDRPGIVDFAGRRWLAAGDREPARLLEELTAAAVCGGVVSDLGEWWDGIKAKLRPHVGSDDEAADLAADVVAGLDLLDVGGQHAVLGGGMGVVERLRRILRANGAPMERAELLRFFPDRNERTVGDVLRYAPFVRVGREAFALDEWGAEPRPTLRDLIYDQVNQHGQVAVAFLEDLAVKYGYSRTSIAFYRSLPDLIEDRLVLRRRRPGDPPAVPAPGLHGDCFRVVAGSRRGAWSCTLTVSHKRLYHGPQTIPPPLAELLAITQGASGVPIRVIGDGVVHASWKQNPYLFGRDLRRALDALGFADGERVHLVVGAGELLIERAPETETDGDLYGTLAAGAGLYDVAGERVADDDIVESLTYAVGLEPGTPLPQVVRRLRDRGNRTLREALELLCADQLEH
ncbi:sigma factor-like helix-turn-helix DNA-binding protein [Geodermatophilus sp. SYSU D00525]